MAKVNVAHSLAQIDAYWSPRVVAELNGQHVKLVKVKGAFAWHAHRHEDELFYVVLGRLTLELREGAVELGPGEFFVVPAGVEHRPVAPEEVHLMLFEPVGIVRTGDF